MRFPGKIYQGKNEQYLAVYNYWPDVYLSTPPSLERKERHVAHVSYAYGNQEKGIDVFTLSDNDDIPEIAIQRKIIRPSFNESVDKVNDIQYEFLHSVRWNVPELQDLIRTDVQDYCKGKESVNPSGSKVKFSSEFTPITLARKIYPKQYLSPGKQEFVPSCALEANIDFSLGCMSSWIPRESNSFFDGEKFYNFSLSPFLECDYCYAIPKHKAFPKTIVELDRKKLKEELEGKCCLEFGSSKIYGKPIQVLRFGKRTEAGSDYTQNLLQLTLETMLETGTRGVLPTKFLRFSNDTADLLKRTNSTVLYSIGFDEFEVGARRHGFCNERRLLEARRYSESGVNTQIYLLIQGMLPSTKRELGLIEFAKKNNLRVQLLPLRYKPKSLVRKMTGQEWDDLKEKGNSLYGADSSCWGSCKVQSGTLSPQKIHQDWLNLVKENHDYVRMCHHTEEKTYCGGCGLHKGFTINTTKVNTVSLRKQKPKRTDKKQSKFDFMENE